MPARDLVRKYGQLLIVVSVFSVAVLFRHLRDQASATALAQRVEEQPRDEEGGHPTAVVLGPWVTPGQSSHGDPAPSPHADPTPTPPSTPLPTATIAPDPSPTAVLPTATPEPLPPTVVPTTVVRLVRKAPTYFGNATFRDGEFTGKAIRTQYGTMQVQVVMKNGRIVDVLPLQEPRATSRSSEIADELIPAWVVEAIVIQDWDVDRVSGATVTWEGFKKAMVYALRAAEQT